MILKQCRITPFTEKEVRDTERMKEEPIRELIIKRVFFKNKQKIVT